MKKKPPANRARCCVGGCHNYTALFYHKDYPICEKHWYAQCDNKFKHKNFKDLRDYLGIPPIEKPKGYEHCDEKCFAIRMEITIDVEQNVPIIWDEELVIWKPSDTSQSSVSAQHYDVLWNGIKKDPIELYTDINGTKIILLIATGDAVRFSSPQAIQAAVDKLQNLVSSTQVDNWETAINKLFNKSKFWTVKDGCSEKAKSAIGAKHEEANTTKS